MSKSKNHMTFKDFKERVSTEEGMARINALLAQKILGKKVVAKGNKFYREEQPCEQYPKGGTFAIKQYTNSAEAIEELIDYVTSKNPVLIMRVHHNHAHHDGSANKTPKYHVSIQYTDEMKEYQKIDQQGNNFSMNIITIAALLRWKGVLQEN